MECFFIAVSGMWKHSLIKVSRPSSVQRLGKSLKTFVTFVTVKLNVGVCLCCNSTCQHLENQNHSFLKTFLFTYKGNEGYCYVDFLKCKICIATVCLCTY